MNTNSPENNNEPSSKWLDQALNAHLSQPPEKPSADFSARCQAAALGAQDVLKMLPYRAQLADQPASLIEHLEALAARAGVSLDRAFFALGVNRTEAPDAASARGLARLARQLDLARDEVVLRLRWGFARLAGVALPAEWSATPAPVHLRRMRGSAQRNRKIVPDLALTRCEATYSPSRRAELRAAVNAVVDAYEGTA